MKPIIVTIISLLILISIFLLTGGIYRTESMQLGVVHRTNIITGEIALCLVDQNCQYFKKKPISNSKKETTSTDEGPAIYPINYYRNKYPEYNDLTDKQIANALYNKYSTESGFKVSKKSFFEVIGYTK